MDEMWTPYSISDNTQGKRVTYETNLDDSVIKKWVFGKVFEGVK